MSTSLPRFRWSPEISRPQPFEVEAFHGESFVLHAEPKNYGSPLLLALQAGTTAKLYYQSPDMAETEWYSAEAVLDLQSGAVEATWSPELDVGKDALRFFLAVIAPDGAVVLRVFGSLRLAASPGFNPATLTPEDIRKEIVEQIKAELEVYVTEAQSSAEASASSAESAKASATSASLSSASAGTSAESAKTSAESSKESAEASAESAESAKANATSASLSSASAGTSAESAKTSAESSKASAEASAESAEEARNSASVAAQASASAETSALNASTSAEEAKTYADEYEGAVDEAQALCEATRNLIGTAPATLASVTAGL